MVHWQHPRFFAYFAANASFPGMLADMLSGALGMIGFSWASSPISTELEMVNETGRCSRQEGIQHVAVDPHILMTVSRDMLELFVIYIASGRCCYSWA